jgi:hypothetical protein
MREPSRDRVRALLGEASQRGRQRIVDWLLRDLHLRGVTFGERSIAISPNVGGIKDILRWSAAQVALAAGDLGMDTATGRPQAFIGGATKSMADTSQVLAVTAQRVVASGSTSVAALTTATITTQTRNASERLTGLIFVSENDAGYGWANTIAGATNMAWWFERTASANQFTLRARNNHATLARTLEWVILGIVP